MKVHVSGEVADFIAYARHQARHLVEALDQFTDDHPGCDFDFELKLGGQGYRVCRIVPADGIPEEVDLIYSYEEGEA